MEASIPIKLRSYRAFKHPWVGRPTTPPTIHTRSIIVDGNSMTVTDVSWNGDTRTVKWQFHKVGLKGKVTKLGSTSRPGFETRFEYDGFVDQIYAEAFDVDGASLGKSAVATTSKPSQLDQGNSTAFQTTYGDDEDVPLSHDVQPGSDNVAGLSLLQQHGKSFVVGLICGAMVIASAWVCTLVFMTDCGNMRRKEQDTKYMPLQQDTDLDGEGI